MNTARLFINGRSQAVRLPKEYRFDDDMDVDDDAEVRLGPPADPSGENGAWVHAWVWVYREDLPTTPEGNNPK